MEWRYTTNLEVDLGEDISKWELPSGVSNPAKEIKIDTITNAGSSVSKVDVDTLREIISSIKSDDKVNIIKIIGSKESSIKKSTFELPKNGLNDLVNSKLDLQFEDIIGTMIIPNTTLQKNISASRGKFSFDGNGKS